MVEFLFKWNKGIQLKLFVLVDILLFFVTVVNVNAALIVNVDFHDGYNKPADTYAAAGMTGYWNVLGSDFDSVDILDTARAATGISLSCSRDLFEVTTSEQTTTGDDAALLRDCLCSSYNDFDFNISGLENGEYDIMLYALGRQDYPYGTTVTVDGDISSQKFMTGIWSGSLVEGQTHTKHRVNISNHSVTLSLDKSADAFMNGFQIIQVPEPTTLFLFSFGCWLLLKKQD